MSSYSDLISGRVWNDENGNENVNVNDGQDDVALNLSNQYLYLVRSVTTVKLMRTVLQ